VRKNGVLNRVIEEKTEGTRRYRNVKEETLGHTIRGTALDRAMDLSQDRLGKELIHFLIFVWVVSRSEFCRKVRKMYQLDANNVTMILFS